MKKIFLNPKFYLTFGILGAICLFFYFDLSSFLNIENFQSNRDVFQDFILDNYFLAVLFYILFYILVISFALPGATPMTLIGGALFGFLAVFYVNIAATIGASLSFFFAKYIAGNSIQKKYSKNLQKVNQNIAENELNYLFFLRFVPIFPFFLVNLLLGLSKVKFRNFLISTILGTLPGTFVYVYAGISLNQINSTNDILSPQILAAFILLAIFSLLPVIFKNKFKNLSN